jgi:alkylhydroperoxidase/carboxymuconolactone decarboxylase family protein YurZ
MPSNDDTRTKVKTDQQQETGPWDTALDQLRQWDPKWAETCVNMSTNPWTSGVLPRKTVELISVALNVACTNLNADGTRRHIRAALDAGATREEILMVFKMASVMSIHSCTLGASILLEEATMGLLEEASDEREKRLKNPEVTPSCDKMRAAGKWNQAWDPFSELAPAWTDEFMAAEIMIYTSGVMPPNLIELLSIAFNTSYTHMYAPGTRRHIKAALRHGATIAEIIEVLKLCVVQGVQTFNLGVPILAKELADRSARNI